jgi:hypothetical protein
MEELPVIQEESRKVTANEIHAVQIRHADAKRSLPSALPGSA